MEKQFNLFTSNRLEILVEKLASFLCDSPLSPLESEIIVVQSKGMAKWVSLKLANLLGICANVSFQFPNMFIYDQFRRVFSDIPDKTSYEPDTVEWIILSLLPTCLDQPEFDPIRSYLGDKTDQLKWFQLSKNIARLFDNYLIYRPEMIIKWDQGDHSDWQSILWKQLSQHISDIHPAALAKRFIEAVQSRKIEKAKFPKRVFVFGISVLPRFHIQLFDAISYLSEMNMFLMNPCAQYWGTILSKRGYRPTKPTQLKLFMPPEPLFDYQEDSNSLLSSMGILGRDFFDILLDYVTIEPYFLEPKDNSLLQLIQSDILNLKDRDPLNKTPISSDDISIQVHSCHSPMREMEVLQDQLLNLFEKFPELLPSDIVVMTPDIEAYSPYIQAVFDISQNDPRRIPFHIADRGVRQESRLIEAFMKIVELSSKRITAAEVFSILETPFVFKKFNISESNLMIIRQWIQDTRIRWGIDAEDRVDMGFLGFKENTWEAGIERLLLGYALPGQEKRLFSGVLPYDYVEADQAVLLGNLIEFTNVLFSFVRSLRKKTMRSLIEWADVLKQIPERFFLIEDESETEMKIIRQMINDLKQLQLKYQVKDSIDRNVIQYYLTTYFKTKGFGFGFLSGGVTFCAMLPMRSIPFKVVCLVGMNGDAFPRTSKSFSFDLIAKYPQKGDRSKRNDDRYLFLESILSARKILYISYVGQNIRDNSIIQPSVLVSELLDYIEKGFTLENKNILDDHIVTKHRLQPFSPEYFMDNGQTSTDHRLFSYSIENLHVAQRLVSPRIPYQPFITTSLSEPPDEFLHITLNDLIRFFNHPIKYLLNRRLGIYLDEIDMTLEEKEIFEIDGLDKYQLAQDMLDWRLNHHDLKEYYEIAKAAGRLPHGTVGEYTFRELARNIEEFASILETYFMPNQLPPLEFELSVANCRIIGTMNSLYETYLLQYRCAKIKAKDHVKTWIHHLILNEISKKNYPKKAVLVGYDDYQKTVGWEYNPIIDSRKILETLVGYYLEGLKRPIHLFPTVCMKYAKDRFMKNISKEEAFKKAKSAWEGNRYVKGEQSDVYHQLCFKQTDPIDDEFEMISTAIFKPMLGCIKSFSLT